MLNCTPFKQQKRFHDPSFFTRNQNHGQSDNKILPMPIIRIHLPNSPKIRKKLKINRYKNFSKISASGPNTLQILKHLRNSSYSTITHKFEFDPYFCDSSCLTELNFALKKLKSIKNFSLILRRFAKDDGVDQLNRISPNIYKLMRLQKIKLEFPSTSNIEEEHILAMHCTLRKCYLLKSFNWTVTEGPILSVKYFESFLKLMKRLVKLEAFREYFALKKGDTKYGVECSQSFQNPPKFSKIKNLELNYSADQQWSGMSDNGDLSTELLACYVSRYVRAENFKCRLRKNYISAQDAFIWMKSIASMPSLKHFDIELLNCEIGEMELMTIAYGLSQSTKIKSVCFRFLQKTPISTEFLMQFMNQVVKINNLQKFDLYFRMRALSSSEISQLENAFSSFSNIHSSSGKHSFRLYK